MTFNSELLIKAENLGLKEKALSIVGVSLDNSIEADLAIGADFLNGMEKAEIIFQFDRYELHVGREKMTDVIRTRIGLYLKDEKDTWVNNLEPIGFYELETDLNGVILDDYLRIEKEKTRANKA